MLTRLMHSKYCADFYFLMNIQKYSSPLFTHTRTIKLASDDLQTLFRLTFYRTTEVFPFFLLFAKYVRIFLLKIFFCGSALQLTCHRFESFIMTKSLWITFVGKSLCARMRRRLSNRRKIPNAGKSSKRKFFEGKNSFLRLSESDDIQMYRK